MDTFVWIIDSTRWDREAQERHIAGLLRVRERQQAVILAPGSAEAGHP
jgi:hypothetical protein